jgi:hypothetical protein
MAFACFSQTARRAPSPSLRGSIVDSRAGLALDPSGQDADYWWEHVVESEFGAVFSRFGAVSAAQPLLPGRAQSV